MEYERNLKYYQSNDKHFFTGIIICGIGVLLFAIGNLLGIRMFRAQTPVAMTIMGIGAIIAFAPASTRSNENDIDSAVLVETDKYDQTVAENINVTLSQRIKPVLFGDFLYDGEGVLLRRGRTDRKYRSSEYLASALIFTKDGIYISQKHFSLIEDKTVETDMEFIYEDMDEVYSVCEERVFGESDKVKIYFFVIKENGVEKARIPVRYNAIVDKVCDDINNAIAEAKGLKK
jgi:hypothetical protein